MATGMVVACCSALKDSSSSSAFGHLKQGWHLTSSALQMAAAKAVAGLVQMLACVTASLEPLVAQQQASGLATHQHSIHTHTAQNCSSHHTSNHSQPHGNPTATHLNPPTGTAAGQDLNLSLDRVNSNRNFGNKLWNAGKFVLFQLEKVDDQEWARLATADFSSSSSWQGLCLSDRWIISSLHQVRVYRWHSFTLTRCGV